MARSVAGQEHPTLSPAIRLLSRRGGLVRVGFLTVAVELKVSRQLLGRALIGGPGAAGVEPERRYAAVGVPETLGDRGNVHAASQQLRCVEVP